MNKKTVGIISVVASCIVCSIAKRFFEKDREKELEEENKMVHDSVEKIFSESRDKRMEKLDLELNKELEESRKRHEEEMKKLEEEMKKLEEERKEAEEKHQINMDKLHQYDLRSKERFENVKTKEEKLAALQEDFKDLHAVSNEICESIFGHKLGGTKIVFKGKLAEMMEEN